MLNRTLQRVSDLKRNCTTGMTGSSSRPKKAAGDTPSAAGGIKLTDSKFGTVSRFNTSEPLSALGNPSFPKPSAAAEEQEFDLPKDCPKLIEGIKNSEKEREDIALQIMKHSLTCNTYTGEAAAFCRASLAQMQETLKKMDDTLKILKESKEKFCSCGEGFVKGESGKCEISIEAVMGILEKSPRAKGIAEVLRRNKVAIKFSDDLAEDDLADYDGKGLIRLSNKLKEREPVSATEVAVLIAHEAFHVQQQEKGTTDYLENEYEAAVFQSLVYHELLKVNVEPVPRDRTVHKRYWRFLELVFTKPNVEEKREGLKEYKDFIAGEYNLKREKVLQEKLKKVPAILRGPARGWLEFWDGEELRQYETLDYQKSKLSSWILFWRRWELDRASKAYKAQEEIFLQWLKDEQEESQKKQ